MTGFGSLYFISIATSWFSSLYICCIDLKFCVLMCYFLKFYHLFFFLQKKKNYQFADFWVLDYKKQFMDKFFMIIEHFLLFFLVLGKILWHVRWRCLSLYFVVSFHYKVAVWNCDICSTDFDRKGRNIMWFRCGWS